MPFSFERIIDDFVFLCSFIGNDFLPRTSSIDIRDGSFDKLIDNYKFALIEMNDYITLNGQI